PRSAGRMSERRAYLDQLPFIEPSDDLFDRLVGVLVLDDLSGRLDRRIMEVAALYAGALLAHQPGLDPDFAGGDGLERLLLRPHDCFPGRVAGLIDGVPDRD